MNIADFTVEIESINLKGFIYSPESSSGPHPMLCICHGLPRAKKYHPGDRGYSALAEFFAASGYLTIIFNFRGAGESEGNFDISGWTRDLSAILDYASSQVSYWDAKNLCLLGFSAGAAVSIYIAAHDQRVSSLVSCACPTVSRLGNDRELAEKYIGEFRKIGIINDERFPPLIEDWMANFNYVYSTRWVGRISPRPLLLVHGTEDEVVPVDSSMQLYKSAGDPKEIVILEGAAHQLRLSDQAMDIVLNWLNAHLTRD